MNLLSKTLGLGLAAALTFTGCAAAATLALGSTTLSAGNTGVTSCGASALTAIRTVDNTGNVTRVDVAGIPAACSGETLSVTLVGAANAGLASGSATVGNCGTTCSAAITSLSATVSAANVNGYSFGLAGQ
jgi:uncharacterized Zn-binding protein involved in type VI secretion